MTKSKIIFLSLIHALGILVYITSVVFILITLGNHFKGNDSPIQMIPFLLLLVFSVGLMTALVFGRPVQLYLNGFKIEAIKFFGYTLTWLFVILILVSSLTLIFYQNNFYLF